MRFLNPSPLVPNVQPPWGSEWHRTFEHHLESWSNSLPESLRDVDENFLQHQKAGDLMPFATMHLLSHLCGSELFQSALPPLQPTSTFVGDSRAPIDFQRRCRDVCLRHVQHTATIFEKVMQISPDVIWDPFCE